MKNEKQNKTRDRRCCMELKHFFGDHKKCSTKVYGRYTEGSGLEFLLGFKSVPSFNRDGTYQVCGFMQRRMKVLQLRSDLTVPNSYFEMLDMLFPSTSVEQNKVDINLDLAGQILANS